MMHTVRRLDTESLETGARQGCVCLELRRWKKEWGPNIYQASWKETPQKQQGLPNPALHLEEKWETQ